MGSLLAHLTSLCGTCVSTEVANLKSFCDFLACSYMLDSIWGGLALPLIQD